MTYKEKVAHMALEEKVTKLEHVVGTLLEVLCIDMRSPDPYACDQHHSHEVKELEDLLQEFHYADGGEYHLLED